MNSLCAPRKLPVCLQPFPKDVAVFTNADTTDFAPKELPKPPKDVASKKWTGSSWEFMARQLCLVWKNATFLDTHALRWNGPTGSTASATWSPARWRSPNVPSTPIVPKARSAAGRRAATTAPWPVSKLKQDFRWATPWPVSKLIYEFRWATPWCLSWNMNLGGQHHDLCLS